MKQKLMELRSTLILAYLKLCIQRKGQFWLHQSSTIVGSNHFLTHPSGMAYRPNHSPNAFFNHYSPQASAMKIKQRKAPQIPLLPIKKQKRMLNQPGQWVVLVAAIWIQAFAGTNFDFPSYSSDLKAALGMSQVELNYLAVASDLGKAFGWCSGVALLYFPLWVVMFMAASMGFLGYGLQWLLLQRIVSLPYSMVCFHSHLFSPPDIAGKKKKNKNHNHVDLNWIHF